MNIELEEMGQVSVMDYLKV